MNFRAANSHEYPERRLPFAALTRYTKIFPVLLMCSSFSLPAQGQSNTCGIAVSRLQNYIQQVNAFASAEYYQNIPARCGLNGNCAQWWLQNLNAWYQQQGALVNEWYGDITRQCTKRTTVKRVRSKRQTDDEPGEIDEGAVEDLKVDDEDKTVRIRIPSTPKGYK